MKKYDDNIKNTNKEIFEQMAKSKSIKILRATNYNIIVVFLFKLYYKSKKRYNVWYRQKIN